MEQIKLDQWFAVVLLKQMAEVQSLQQQSAHIQELVTATDSLSNIAATIASLKSCNIIHLDSQQLESLIQSLQLESLLQDTRQPG